MGNEQLRKQVIDHLEFLGYEIEQDSSDGQPSSEKWFKVDHPLNAGFFMYLNEMMLGFSSTFNLDSLARTNKQELYKTVNDCNERYIIKLVVTEEEGEIKNLFCSLIYNGLYEKKAFGLFVNEWNMEMMNLASSEINKFVI